MPRETRTTATRARMIAAAREALIAGEGDFEMTEFARLAGVSAGLAYHHFGSKDGLIAAVLDDFYDRQLAALREEPAVDGSWSERELQRFRTWLAFLYEDPLARIVLGKMGRTVPVAELEARRLDEQIELARHNLEAGQQSGELSESIDASVAATAIIGAMRQSAMRAFSEAKPPDPGPLATQLWDFISGALGLRADR